MVEVNLDALRIARENELSAADYHDLMFDRLDQASEIEVNLDERMKALGEFKRDKLRVVKAYNKRVKEKSFQVGDLVWKMIFPIEAKSNKFRKWLSNWRPIWQVWKIGLSGLSNQSIRFW
jgi:hypothetical protein